MTIISSDSSLRKNAPRICLFIKEGFLLNDPGRIVNRKRKLGRSKDDLSSRFVVMCRAEVKARPSQRRPHITYELMIPPEWIERIVTLKKPRGKHTKVFVSTAELTRRLDAFERACDIRFEVLFQAINQLMRLKAPKHRPIGARAKTPKIRRRRRVDKV